MEVQQQQKIVKKSRSHLLRHELPNVDLEEAFGTTDGREIAKDIARWGQKELQARRLAPPAALIRQGMAVQLRPAHNCVCACRRSSRWSTGRRRSLTTTTGCGGNSWKVRLVAGIRKYQLAGLCAQHGVLCPSHGMLRVRLLACRGCCPMP